MRQSKLLLFSSKFNSSWHGVAIGEGTNLDIQSGLRNGQIQADAPISKSSMFCVAGFVYIVPRQTHTGVMGARNLKTGVQTKICSNREHGSIHFGG